MYMYVLCMQPFSLTRIGPSSRGPWFGATRWSIPRGMEAGPLNLAIVELRVCFLVVRNWCQLTHVELVTQVTHSFGDNIRHRDNIDVQPVAWDCVWSCTVQTFSIVIVWLALHGACHANMSSGHLAICNPWIQNWTPPVSWGSHMQALSSN